MVRIPARFLRHKSAARGVTVESFIARQEDEDTRYCTMLYCIVLYSTVLYCTVLYCTVDTRVEFGFAGYRGLHGSPSRRPSEIVEKILHTLVSWVYHGASSRHASGV